MCSNWADWSLVEAVPRHAGSGSEFSTLRAQGVSDERFLWQDNEIPQVLHRLQNRFAAEGNLSIITVKKRKINK